MLWEQKHTKQKMIFQKTATISILTKTHPLKSYQTNKTKPQYSKKDFFVLKGIEVLETEEPEEKN